MPRQDHRSMHLRTGAGVARGHSPYRTPTSHRSVVKRANANQGTSFRSLIFRGSASRRRHPRACPEDLLWAAHGALCDPTNSMRILVWQRQEILGTSPRMTQLPEVEPAFPPVAPATPPAPRRDRAATLSATTRRSSPLPDRGSSRPPTSRAPRLRRRRRPSTELRKWRCWHRRISPPPSAGWRH